jgi:hypothetical protein
MRRKPRRWVLFVAPSVVHVVSWLGLMAGFRYLEPLREVTEALVCEPDEELVFETMTYVGGNRSGYSEKSCCAKRDDARTHGRCNWGSSLEDSSELLVGLVPLGISLGTATSVAGVLLLALIARHRAVRRWARERARATDPRRV